MTRLTHCQISQSTTSVKTKQTSWKICVHLFWCDDKFELLEKRERERDKKEIQN